MTSTFSEFHAHIYFDSHTQSQAEELYSRAPAELSVSKMGRFHTRCVGPHPTWMFSMEYNLESFEQVTLWLMQNLNGLCALVHPLSGDDLADHTTYALWFSRELQLNLPKL
jgi:aromatic ring-cleaving dioxygenase